MASEHLQRLGGRKTSYPDEIRKAASGHTVGDAVQKAYQRTDLLEKRRELMNDWAKFSLSVQKKAWQLINGKTSKLAHDIKFTLRRTPLRAGDQLLRKVAEAIQKSVSVGMSAIETELLDRSSQQDSGNLVSQGSIAALYEHVHQRKLSL
jgi:hypothetical protein